MSSGVVSSRIISIGGEYGKNRTDIISVCSVHGSILNRLPAESREAG